MATYSDEEPDVQDEGDTQEEQGYEEGFDSDEDPDPYNEGSPPTQEERSQADDIMHPSIKVCSSEGEFLPMSGTIDTGCEDSWINLDKLQDYLGLDYDELDGTATTTFTTFNGSSMQALGQVTIQWHTPSSGKSNELFCLVGSAEVPFDVLFGSIYFTEHAFEEFQDPLLILKAAPMAKEAAAAFTAAGHQHEVEAAASGVERRASAAAQRAKTADDGDDEPE